MGPHYFEPADDTGWVPAGAALGSIELDEPCACCVPVEVIALVRYVHGETGRSYWGMRWSRGMRDPVDRLGPLATLLASDQAEAEAAYSRHEED